MKSAIDASTGPTVDRAYPIYRASGSHRELGRQHGEQAKAPEYIPISTTSISRSACRTKCSSNVRWRSSRSSSSHCPHLVDEIRGLGEGAGIAFHEALAVNIRSSLGLQSEEGCTSFVVGPAGTATGETLIGQTSDTLPNVMDFGYVLHLQPDDKPEVLIWTFGGMIGYHGINSAGVGHFANDLGDGGPAPRFGLPHYPLKRMMLECSSMDAVVGLFETVQLSSNGNYVICDGSGEILDIEATTVGPELIGDDGKGFIGHANHFCSARYATQENHRQSVADSFPRQLRIDELIGERYGALSVASLQEILQDDANDPAAICRHPRSTNMDDGFELAGQTVAALIAEPAQQRLHVTCGPPCENPFVTYTMDA